MKLELATVLSCDPNGCQVKPVDGGPVFTARYSAMAQDRVIIHAGQLVALDMEPAVPEISWRWHRAIVVEPGEHLVLVQDRERQISAARVPGLDIGDGVGDEVWLTGVDGAWEVHDRVVNGNPSDPARMREKVLPRIAVMLAEMERKRE